LTDLSKQPYYDRFDPDKNRTKVLFHPDRPLQQAELNELQSIAEHNLKRLGDSMFSDGAIQTGMAFSFNEEGKITVEDGLVYLEGKIRVFQKQSIDFTGVGTENIGVKVVKTIVDYISDSSLLDQTQNVENYLSPGADRLEERVVLTINDDSTPAIYHFEDGKLFIEPNRPEFTMLNNVLAQRTFEESGSYQVSGFKVWTEKSQVANMVDLVIDGGIAYVLGYRINKPTSTRIQIPKSQAFNSILQETTTYDSARLRVKVGSSYVKEVKNVVARTVSPSGGVSISKGTVDGRDAIPAQYTNIDPTTLTVYTNSPAKVYTRGLDYNLVSDSGVQYIDWNVNINGTEPVAGTTYLLSFEYDRVMVKGVDYKVTTIEPDEAVPGWETFVDFTGMAGLKPKNGGAVRTDYDYYLARTDLVTLDSQGKFTVLEGQPNREALAKAPDNRDPLTLTIGRVFLYPNSDITRAQNTAIRNLRMEDLQNMKTRLENVEYNQAILMLEKQATQTQDPLTLRGVFADAFTDFSKMDLGISSVALSFDDATMTLPVNMPASQMKNPAISNSSIAASWGRIVTAPFQEVKEVSQPLATSAWNVNPYAVYNKQGVLTLDPTSDSWIDEEKITVNEEDVLVTTMRRWYRHLDDEWGILSDFHQNLVDNTQLIGGSQWGESMKYATKAEGIMVSTAQSTVDSAIEYIRPREINFRATNLTPLTDNLFLTFDGVRVQVQPTGSTVPGIEAGTLRANGKGEVTGKFMIPSGIRCGTREVTLQNSENLATSTYTAEGTRRVTTETITKTRVTFNLYDPLAQSFAFQQARVITSVGVYFGSKSSTDNIIMQIRGLSEGGLPNRTVYSERLLTPADILVSEDASVETKIALDDPLMVQAGESYCVVFITDSTDYTMWGATLGKPLVNDRDNLVVSQPYVNGVLFSSSNAVSWTVHQDTDLKFNIYTANFAETGVIEFDTITNIDSDGILLMANYLTPANTGCMWEVKMVSEAEAGTVSIDSVPWQPLINYSEIETNVVVAQLKLRATFKSNRYISPMLALDDLLLVNFVSATTGDYITKTVDQTEAPFNRITLSYDLFAPAGSRVTPYYSVDGGATWKEFTATPSTAQASSEFTRYTFIQDIGSTETSIKYKLTLTADNRFVRPRVRRLTALTTDAI
jgi:hypothetical protein